MIQPPSHRPRHKGRNLALPMRLMKTNPPLQAQPRQRCELHGRATQFLISEADAIHGAEEVNPFDLSRCRSLTRLVEEWFKDFEITSFEFDGLFGLGWDGDLLGGDVIGGWGTVGGVNVGRCSCAAFLGLLFLGRWGAFVEVGSGLALRFVIGGRWCR